MDREQTPSESQQLANQMFDSADAEQQKAISERVAAPAAMSRQRSVQIALGAAVPILIGVLLVNFGWQPVMSFFEPSPPPAMARQQAGAMLDALVVDIEAFRTDYGELPDTLVEIGVPPRGEWIYTALSDARFTVQGLVYGQSVRFDSSTNPGTGTGRP